MSAEEEDLGAIIAVIDPMLLQELALKTRRKLLSDLP